MEYNILGVNIQKQVTIRKHQALPKDGKESYKVYVAWQSNIDGPDFPFLWRCTSDVIDHFPTEADIRDIAARSYDEHDTKRVKRLFPCLPPTRLTD